MEITFNHFDLGVGARYERFGLGLGYRYAWKPTNSFPVAEECFQFKVSHLLGDFQSEGVEKSNSLFPKRIYTNISIKLFKLRQVSTFTKKK